MPEYIERSSAAAYFENSKKVMWHKDDVVAAISSSAIPAADVAEVRHGYWKDVLDFGNGDCFGFCSVCGTEHKARSYAALRASQKCCRWCGAKMDGKGEGE